MSHHHVVKNINLKGSKGHVNTQGCEDTFIKRDGVAIILVAHYTILNRDGGTPKKWFSHFKKRFIQAILLDKSKHGGRIYRVFPWKRRRVLVSFQILPVYFCHIVLILSNIGRQNIQREKIVTPKKRRKEKST